MGVRLILGFAISFTVFIIAPALLPQQLAAGPVPQLGDAVELLMPFVLVPMYYLLYRSAEDWAFDPPSGPLTALFMVAAIIFIDGHGMHLAANSISHFLKGLPGSDAYAITYFYDEVLSHYMLRLGTLGFAGVLLWRHYQPVKKGVNMWHIGRRQRLLLGVAAALYGLTVALAAIEGQTVLLDLPAALVIAVLFGLFWWRQRHLPGAPVFSFLGMGYVAATIVLGGWGLFWSGFPQFSELGIIK